MTSGGIIIRILSKVGEGTSVDMRIPKEVKKDET